MRGIKRHSVADPAALLAMFQQGPAEPLILTDATDLWPARQKWSLDFFAREYGGQFGVILGSFSHEMSGKATTLGQFIAGLDQPLSHTGGFWVDEHLHPVVDRTDADESKVWSFCWRAFDVAPELRGDITPYHVAIPNLVAGLEPDVFHLLEKLSGLEFFSLYISRAGTVTPLHSDHSHTLGSLVQFAGEKLVWLYDVAEAGDAGLNAFNPEEPDFAAFPHMRAATPHRAELQHGELLIIPPSWPHYTRALGHSITLSHNFFNQFNFSAYLRDQLGAMVRGDRSAELCRAIEKLVANDAGVAGA